MNDGTVILSNVLDRRRHSLDGDWNVIVDPYEMGYVGIMEQRNDRGFFRDHSPRHPGDRVEYDFDTSPTLRVPGDWNTQDDRLHYYEGTVWYRRKVSVTDAVRNWRDSWPAVVPMQHPSPRNNRWLKTNPWFEQELVPELQSEVARVLSTAG